MKEILSPKFELAMALEGLRFLRYSATSEEWADFENMYCAKDM